MIRTLQPHIPFLPLTPSALAMSYEGALLGKGNYVVESSAVADEDFLLDGL